MSRTITVDAENELLSFIGKLAESDSKLEAFRQLIDDGENSGDLQEWSVNSFLDRMKASKNS